MRGGAVYNRWTGNANKQKRQVGWHKGEEKMPFNCRTMDPLRATPSHAFTGLLTAWRSESMSRGIYYTRKNKEELVFPNFSKLNQVGYFSSFFVSKRLARGIYIYINISSQFEISGTRSPRGVERGDKVSDVSARTSERIDF